MGNKIKNADRAGRTPAIGRTALPGTPGCRPRESRAPAATGRVDPNGQAPAAPPERPTLLDPLRQGMARVAYRLDGRAARHGATVASPMATSPLGTTLKAEPPGPPQY